jgi:hypothetical protein
MTTGGKQSLKQPVSADWLESNGFKHVGQFCWERKICNVSVNIRFVDGEAHVAIREDSYNLVRPGELAWIGEAASRRPVWLLVCALMNLQNND